MDYEDSYPHTDESSSSKNDNILEQLIKLNKSDRDLYEKSIKAFVSWVRSYNEHQASFIFNLKNLDLGKVAKSFGLFRVSLLLSNFEGKINDKFKLPKMPETKTLKIDFTPIDVNVSFF